MAEVSEGWKMVKPVGRKLVRRLGELWKWQLVRARVLEMVGKRNEGGFKQLEDISNLRSLLKRNQELSAFYAMQSSAGQGSPLQGRFSLVMGMSRVHTLRVQDSVRGCRRLAEAHCRS